MKPLGAAALNAWNSREAKKKIGLIVVTFDQRNHGSREVNPQANEAWRSDGTATDVSILMTYLSSYVFPSSDRDIVSNIVLGVSLGGHAAWHCLFHDSRVTAAIIVIGCPDFFSLMSDRARLSKLPSWTESSVAGSKFLGSQHFPQGLVRAVETYDPAGLLLGKLDSSIRSIDDKSSSATEQARLLSLLKRALEGKRILNLSGGADRLVPYECGQAFLEWLKVAIAPGNWFAEGFYLEDIQFDDVGHWMSPGMVDHAICFLAETLEKSFESSPSTTPITAKI
ncbi:MAG: hypothetical protein Q9222_004810 [Ikaeria aurantiellina]